MRHRASGNGWAAYRPTKGLLFWAAAAGAVATVVVGFAWGGWVTGGTAKRMAEAAAAGARDQLVAAVCVDRFQAGGDAQAQLAALKLLQGYRPRLVHREGRLGGDARQGQADQRGRRGSAPTSWWPSSSSAARPGAVTPGPRSSHRVDRCRLGRSIRACRCARWRNPRDEPEQVWTLGEATWPRRASRISSTWRPRSRSWAGQIADLRAKARSAGTERQLVMGGSSPPCASSNGPTRRSWPTPEGPARPCSGTCNAAPSGSPSEFRRLYLQTASRFPC